MRQARQTMIAAIRKDIATRFGGVDAHEVYLDLAHTNNYEEAEDFRKEVEEAFPGYKVGYVDPLSLSISCHIGDGSLAIGATRILNR